MTKFEKVGIFIREQFWLEPNLFPYKYSNILKLSHSSYLAAYEDGAECSETSAYKIQTPVNYSEESIQHSEDGESLKSGTKFLRKSGSCPASYMAVHPVRPSSRG